MLNCVDTPVPFDDLVESPAVIEGVVSRIKRHEKRVLHCDKFNVPCGERCLSDLCIFVEHFEGSAGCTRCQLFVSIGLHTINTGHSPLFPLLAESKECLLHNIFPNISPL